MKTKAPAVCESFGTHEHMELMDRFAAHNYHPLPIVVSKAEGVWVEDVDGRRYMDMLAAYSALNFGHRHPALIEVAKEQLDKVTLTSRAFHNDQLGPFCEALAELCGMEVVLPMNTGAEAVETAIKTSRKWGYQKKGIPANKAKIAVCSENFHGRTTTIVSFSTDPQARQDFGPFTPGFEVVQYGDLAALDRALLDDHVAALIIEPIQGEAGIVVPPKNYLAQARELCSKRNVLFVADEIQSGLGRCGATFCVETEGVRPDMLILGKALGGGIVPISAVVSSKEILGVFRPGEHGSTFGGNPLACAVGRKVIDLLNTRQYQDNARELGAYFFDLFRKNPSDKIKEVRGRGLWIGIELHSAAGKARPYCERLMHEGVLCKDTHEQVIRLAPPLCITRDEIDWAFAKLRSVLA